ncbi:M48 family metallopeptidase [Xinfangfangia sp. CPCC 101601]|uniref:M48 family metallopeptidase n=1 Tax=Pseudogemmobacter lacusdianii TaxID=3069608 RepID=A0ABU0VV06_9RHOB|nr:M48 family metallopeptidase [Xinfangfangia sp. CPCC 101601]MDQ2064815.1 M48 family metallopeptidase [Xinfangfangia sp. CPCC 101601]
MSVFRPFAALLSLLGLAACASPVEPLPTPRPDSAEARFVAVAARIEPVAEAFCRELRRGPKNCDIQIAVDDRPGQAPNAFQTLDGRGRPYVVFTLSLIKMARNADELAFVMGHESAHHIAGHIPRRLESAQAGAMLAGVLAAQGGWTPEEILQAQAIGADIGAMRYAQEFELEADALGSAIALRAGYDPIIGARFFDRLPDPGQGFLNSHPPNARRKAVVAEVVARASGS